MYLSSKEILQYKACSLTSYLNYYICIQWIHVSVPVHIYTQTHKHIYLHVREHILPRTQEKGTDIVRVRKRQMQKDVEGNYDKCNSHIMYLYNLNWYES